MTTSLQTDPRRASRDAFRKPGRLPLEMPVLFQLADLSVQQVKAAPLPSVPAPIIPPAPLVEAVVVPAALPVIAPQEEPLHLEVPKFEVLNPEPVVVEVPRVELSQAEAPREELIPAAAETENKHAAGGDLVTEPAADSMPSVSATSQTSATDTSPPLEATAPTPRAPTEQRWKSRQPVSAHGDWMRTHGKFIAVAFVIALIATIYMAQNGDEPAPANPDAAASASTDGEAKSVADETASGSTDSHAAKESIPVVEHQRPGGLAGETSPAASVADHAHAELHPPLGHGTIQEPIDVREMADAKSLFPWKDADQTRVASKPDDGRAKPEPGATPPKPEAPPLTEPTPTEGPTDETPSIYGPPSSVNREPAAQPANGGPQLPAPAAYPVTNQSSYRTFEPPQARPNAGQQRATPASFDNAPPPRTSGPRHERTGSGLY